MTPAQTLPASLPNIPLTRAAAGAGTAVLAAAILLPLRRLGRPGARDSFPFSQYPMFSAARKPHYWVTHLLGERADGSREVLHHRYLGTGGLNAVRRQLRRRVAQGDAEVIAQQVARRVATRRRPEDRGIVRVHVVRGRYLLEPFMAGADRERWTTRVQIRGTAEIPRPAATAAPAGAPGAGR